LVKGYLKLSAVQRKALKLEQDCQLRANQKVDNYIVRIGVKGRPDGVEYLETPSLNEATVVTAIAKCKPTLCVVLGTSIIRPRILAIPSMGTINAHTSILPEYRGSRSEFWQCYNQDYTHVGITLHLVEAGVDTGGILFQQRQEVHGNPEPFDLRANNTIATLSNYVAVINGYLTGQLRSQEQGPSTTPTYRFRDITEEKRIALYTRLLNHSSGKKA
jgi:methionyl-tRNA formyltransferase